MKKIGFLSFGHWTPSPQSQTRSAADTLLQSIDLAVAAEELGADGAYFRVHHFARQLASPFPLLAAVGARTSRIEIGTAVIDMATRTRSTWSRMRGQQISSPEDGCSSASAAVRPSR
jgi:alkanesulfonate monooxygenase SsuD/methylene tetrahydromethanopterin reductase-like flavin-dependent oxidoreductase (luciferase family)